MTTVGIRELKLRLSAYLRQVKAGEAVQVTDRGQVVAEIIPARARSPRGLTPEGEAMVRAGTLRLATAPRSRNGLQRVTTLPPGTVQRMLDEMRGER